MAETENRNSNNMTDSEKLNLKNNDDDQNDNEVIVNNVELKLLNNNANGAKSFFNYNKNRNKSEQDCNTTEKINIYLRDMPLTDDTSCGFWIFKGSMLQKFANQTSYVILYGLAGCMFSMTYAYFNGTLTTIEKRFKIPSKNTGVISVGYDISQVLTSAVLSYYAGRGHRPRWIGFGLFNILIFCILTASLHFIYGPGEDALALTAEFGAFRDENATLEILEKQRSETLCRIRDISNECEESKTTFTPQVILFLSTFISGIGGTLYYSLGITYMDDNVKKSRAPVFLSLSYFLRMLGPAIGYAIASLCLKVYIAPRLHPVIDENDSRWLGAWWMGWLVIGFCILITGTCLSMFPRELPRAAARREVVKEQERNRTKAETKKLNDELEQKSLMEHKSSFADMMITFKSLITNKTLMYNNFSSVFYFIGYTPYWIFTPKYIEIIYRQSASTSSMVTGSVAFAFSAIGVLLAGFVISRYKPRARYMAAWNVIVGFLTVAGIMTYSFIGCPGNEQSVVVNSHDKALNSTPTCNSACGCDYVSYSPVCGENNMTYISPCHAGCTKQHIGDDGEKFFYDCSCIPSTTTRGLMFDHLKLSDLSRDNMTTAAATTPNSIAFLSSYTDLMLPTGGQALPGACPVNCFPQFVTFLIVMCFLKFIGAAGRASNFLVSVRCVPEKDKTASIGFNMMMMSMMAFIPSPIFFGWVLDRLCLVWGKTCSNKGNCWLYDSESLRYTLNMTAAAFITVGVIFDCGVWYYVKDLKIFDDTVVKDVEMKTVKNNENKMKT